MGARDLPRRRIPVRARGRDRGGGGALRPPRLCDRLAGHPARLGRDRLRLRLAGHGGLPGQAARPGRAALRAARPGRFPLGQRGAGRSTSVGKTFDYAQGEPAGQGAAFRQVGETRLAVFTVVNAVGAVVDRDGAVVRGHLDVASGLRGALVPGVEERLRAGRPVRPLPGNTTLTVAVTNQRLDWRGLRTLGRQVHASMARAIHPFHALVDGDVLYAVTTNEVDSPVLESIGLGVLCSELAWDAVLSAVRVPT
ncbi:MAG: P1 family peptidase [Gaiellaceae bacterium]